MDGAQGWREQLEVLIGSELAHRVIRPGEERMFTLDFEDWLTSIDVHLRLGEPGYGNDPTYLEDRVASFVDHEVAEGRMVPQDMTAREDIPALFDTLSQIARTYDAEAVQERALAFERAGPDSDLGRAPRMDDNRTWQEQLDAFMQSERGSSVIRPGMETAFTGDFDDWLRSLNLDRWEGDVGFGEYLEDRLERFWEHQLDAGHLDPPHLGEVGFEPMLWDALYDIAMAGLEGRYYR